MGRDTTHLPVWCDIRQPHTIHERVLLTELTGDGTTVQLVEHGRGDTPTDLTLVLVRDRLDDVQARLPDDSALRIGWGMMQSVRGRRIGAYDAMGRGGSA